MKELSIEEKAKAYDEALEVLHKYDGANIMFSQDLKEEMFPELKESEDERIKNWIRKELESKYVVDNIVNNVMADKALAWLEKQGEQKSIWHNEDEEPQRGSLILLIMQSGNPIVAKIIEPNHTFNHGERWAYIDDLLEKQCEQNLVDKVEPKFHEGDWVVFNNKHQSIYQVEKIEDGYYILRHTHGGTFRVCVLHDESLRLWTIQDAKDGDVLVASDKSLFIYNGNINESNNAGFYLALTQDMNIILDSDDGCGWEEKGSCYPATKEQRDLLFQKMKESGYEWDAKKKELKKIEDKPLVIDEGKAEMDRNFTEMMLKDYTKQKTAWSEQDEEILNLIIARLHSHPNVDLEEYSKEYDWLNYNLKSLKPQNTWKPSDEQLYWLKWAANRMPDTEKANEAEAVLEDLLEQLKKLMEE